MHRRRDQALNTSSRPGFDLGPRRESAPVRRRSERPSADLLVGGGAPSTIKRYQNELDRFGRLLTRWGRTSLYELLRTGEAAALALWCVLNVIMGYDAYLMGVSDGGNFLAAMNRTILESIAIQEGPVMSVEPILSLARQAWRRWRELEPYEYRLPAPRRILFAACGYAVLRGEWPWLL